VEKYIRPYKCAFSDIFASDLTRRVVAFCMGIAIYHRRKFGATFYADPPWGCNELPWLKLTPA